MLNREEFRPSYVVLNFLVEKAFLPASIKMKRCEISSGTVIGFSSEDA